MNGLRLLFIAGLFSLSGLSAANTAPSPIEPPYLAQQVAQGDLLAVNQRMPALPYVDQGQTKDQPISGGTLQLLMGKSKDTRHMVVYGYARLVGFNQALKLEADLLESYEVKEGRIFTLKLRQGHRWSDGHLFSSEDFRYYWQNVANNQELASFGPPKVMKVDGQFPEFEVLGPLRVRYTWAKPNPDFLLALAGPRPLYIYRPAHYLKQFHKDFANPNELQQRIDQAKIKRKSWYALHQSKDHPYKFNNPDLPTLQPWMITTYPPSERFVFKRNPYYHRMDLLGNQLPYIDEVVMTISSSKLVPAKTGAGESDLQGRYLRLDNYTFLKEGEPRNNYSVRLWRTSRGARVALYPNLNANDPVWRKLFQTADFRRALSLSINRHEINQVIYFGLALAGADTLIPESPLYRPEYRQKWAQFDIDKANKLLDQLGLKQRDSLGVRLLPDGRPMEIIVQTAGESTEETDVLELIHDSWMQAGIKLHSKPSEREVFRNRVFSGEALMSIWTGLPNGIASADMNPAQLAPTSQQQLQWPKWGKHYETGQEEPPELPAVKRLLELNQQWQHATNMEQRHQAWREMLEIRADQVFTLGTVAKVLQPIVVNKNLMNIPEQGLWNWQPNAYFGVYRPDRFWLRSEGKPGGDH
ncbi:MAG: ABC transporter substrate-binding protein [Motiliproteus sp.]|nr:ABC transporter substrate-binding protein [Motiliproteus sp.]MCW9051945.1 ABC transporter substrate-binding protein [Motiliproteus sp.]